jgi:hypothetical protein
LLDKVVTHRVYSHQLNWKRRSVFETAVCHPAIDTAHILPACCSIVSVLHTNLAAFSDKLHMVARDAYTVSTAAFMGLTLAGAYVHMIDYQQAIVFLLQFLPCVYTTNISSSTLPIPNLACDTQVSTPQLHSCCLRKGVQPPQAHLTCGCRFWG